MTSRCCCPRPWATRRPDSSPGADGPPDQPAASSSGVHAQHGAGGDRRVPAERTVTPGRLGHHQRLVGPVDRLLHADVRLQHRQPERRRRANGIADRIDDHPRHGKPLADVLDHSLPGRQVRPGQRDQELVAAVAKHLVVRAKVFRHVLHYAGQHPVARGMPIRVVDLLQVVEVHEGDAAVLHVAPRELTPFAQRRQDFTAGVRAGEGIAIAQRARDLVTQRFQFEVQPLAACHEIVVVLAGDRLAGGRFAQQLRRDVVQPLVFRFDRGERRLVPEFRGRVLVIPLAKATQAMCVLLEVVRIARQAADDRADQVLVPVGMVVCSLLQLLQRPAQCCRVHVEHRRAPVGSNAAAALGARLKSHAAAHRLQPRSIPTADQPAVLQAVQQSAQRALPCVLVAMGPQLGDQPGQRPRYPAPHSRQHGGIIGPAPVMRTCRSACPPRSTTSPVAAPG